MPISENYCVLLSAYFELEMRSEVEEEVGSGRGVFKSLQVTGSIPIALNSLCLDSS